MTTLGIVYNNFLSPRFAGGGAVHSYEVVTRLKKYFKIIYFPSSPVFKWNKEILEKKAKELEREGIKVADEFYQMLDYKITRFNTVKIAKEVASQYNVDEVDLLYEPDHTSFDIFFFKKKYGITFHEPPYYDNSLRYLRRLMKFYTFNPSTGKGFYTRFLYNEIFSKRIHKKLMRNNPPTFIAGVSEGPLIEANIKGYVLRPGNAFDPELLKYRNRGKEDYVVFWSRLNQDKGIQEIPDILRIMEKEIGKKIKLKLMGKFFDKFNEKRFWSKIKKFDLHVEYLGFVDRKTLYDVVSKAKLLIYPSHVDGFSLVVLESLALGTPVVAYDIPAIKSVYNNLSAVRIVKEFDIRGMANEGVKILSLGEKEIEDLMNEERLLNFLNMHSSWDNVANEILNLIKKYI